MEFDLINIRLFVDVAELNSVTRGAERSNMTPPSASLRIKNIEDRMHTKLLNRSNRGVTLTPAGKAFLHHGRLMLLHAQQLQDDLRSSRRASGATFGCAPTPARCRSSFRRFWGRSWQRIPTSASIWASSMSPGNRPCGERGDRRDRHRCGEHP